jgi:hypothetical protein
LVKHLLAGFAIIAVQYRKFNLTIVKT